MSQNKLNILFLNSWYPNRLEPQNGNFIQRHAEAVAQICNVASLHVIPDQNVRDYEMFVKKSNGVFEVVVYYPKPTSFLKKFYDYMTAHKIGYERIVQQFGHIDLTHLNVIYRAGIFALHLKNKLGIPYIVTEHWTAFLKVNPKKFSWIEKFWIKRTAKKASYICPVSDNLKSAIQQFGIKGKYRVVPNVVDTKLFSSVDKKVNEIIQILHVSSLFNEHKNIKGILNVICKLSKKRKDFHISLVGNTQGNEAKKYAQTLALDPNIYSIEPEIPLEKIAAKMKSHDIFILFSNYENLPCVISEAHCSGMVVISSDVGGIDEMINEENGILVEYQDEEDLLTKLDQLLNNFKKYDPVKISKEASEKYSYKSVAKQYKSIYDEVLNIK